jgi:hypothetical protein
MVFGPNPTPPRTDKKTGWIEGASILGAIFIVVMVTAVNDYQKEQQFRQLNAVKDDVMVCAWYWSRHQNTSKTHPFLIDSIGCPIYEKLIFKWNVTQRPMIVRSTTANVSHSQRIFLGPKHFPGRTKPKGKFQFSSLLLSPRLMANDAIKRDLNHGP